MGYYIIIRGPAASGKSTIAKRLAKELDAYYIDFDSILARHNLDKIEGDGISTENFVRGNEIIMDEIIEMLEKGRVVVIDACLYRKGHIGHLTKNLPYKHYIFSLKASLEECIRRNRSRGKGMTKKDVRDVFVLVSRLDVGIPIITEGRSVDDVVSEIKSHLSS